MEFRQFGRTGLKVSAVGFGCWEIGGAYGRIDESQFQRAVARQRPLRPEANSIFASRLPSPGNVTFPLQQCSLLGWIGNSQALHLRERCELMHPVAALR